MPLRVLALALALLVAPVAGASTVVSLPAAQDVSFPFACSWGYDWEERCWRDDSPRLPIGGEDDKAWRAALRFPLAALPASATVAWARLDLWYDRTCIGPYAADRRCDGRAYTLDVHTVLSDDWFAEREPELAWLPSARFLLPARSGPRWMAWDVTGVVEDWHYGIEPNRGLVVRLPDAEEWPARGGPKPPSSSFAVPELRPRLVVAYD